MGPIMKSRAEKKPDYAGAESDTKLRAAGEDETL